MRVEASVGRGAKKSDTILTRVRKLTLTAELLFLPFEEHKWLARLCKQIRSRGVEQVVQAAEAAEPKASTE